MTSFLTPITSRLSRFWNASPEGVCALSLFGVLMIHGATIGLTDDEAYYWVLAQRPAWGYAYHPPMVAWVIALSQALVGWFLGAANVSVVRLPSALISATVFGLALGWLREIGVGRERIAGCAWVVVSLAGLFALSWMMVPDLPLFLGWILAFRATWKICFSDSDRTLTYGVLLAATTLAILSKFSAVLMTFSCALALLAWAPRARLPKAATALALGCALAAAPIIAWNMSREWGAILYQIHDRHEGASISFVRYARFWLIEFFAGGPPLILFGLGLLARPGTDRVRKFLWVFAAPAAVVFLLQPMISDFKPHWAIVVWWPAALALAWEHARAPNRRATWQMRYGLVLGAVVLFACHVPVGNLLVPNPKLDPTNDLFGWSRLAELLRAQPGNADLSVPVVGSRYQTASQAYFALGKDAPVTLIPRDLKARDEWPDLGISTDFGPDWPELLKPVFFVADNRYDAPPEFRKARCAKTAAIEEKRAGKLAKRIDVWRCEPDKTGDGIRQ